MCCVKIVNNCPAFLEYYPCATVKVYVDEQVQFSVDGDPELGIHCVNGEYVCKVLLLEKTSKGNSFRVAVW